MLICPNCKCKLNKLNNTYKCLNNHSFDIAKEGYVNLLLNKPTAGDNKIMIASRKDFLEKGYFDPLLRKTIDIIDNLKLHNPFIVDIGCADGFYTNAIANKYPTTIGIDISKVAIRYAAKKYKDTKFFIANAKDLPLDNNSATIILNIFAPFFSDEYYRVLKDNGYIIKITPNRNHLYEIKTALYDDVYLSKQKQISNVTLNLIASYDLSYQVNLHNKDILNLFSMTPYLYKTPTNNIKKLNVLDSLLVTLDFSISLYKKHSNQKLD